MTNVAASVRARPLNVAKANSAGTRTSPRGLAQTGKKKPPLITVGASVMVEAAGIEPASASIQPSALHA